MLREILRARWRDHCNICKSVGHSMLNCFIRVLMYLINTMDRPKHMIYKTEAESIWNKRGGGGIVLFNFAESQAAIGQQSLQKERQSSTENDQHCSGGKNRLNMEQQTKALKQNKTKQK